VKDRDVVDVVGDHPTKWCCAALGPQLALYRNTTSTAQDCRHAVRTQNAELGIRLASGFERARSTAALPGLHGTEVQWIDPKFEGDAGVAVAGIAKVPAAG
jgi:hypothetical protein